MVETSTLKAVLSFCPLPLSSGVSFGFFFSLLLDHATVSPSGYTNARSRGDKGTDVFLEQVYTMWSLPLSITLEATDS